MVGKLNFMMVKISISKLYVHACHAAAHVHMYCTSRISVGRERSQARIRTQSRYLTCGGSEVITSNQFGTGARTANGRHMASLAVKAPRMFYGSRPAAEEGDSERYQEGTSQVIHFRRRPRRPAGFPY